MSERERGGEVGREEGGETAVLDSSLCDSRLEGHGGGAGKAGSLFLSESFVGRGEHAREVQSPLSRRALIGYDNGWAILQQKREINVETAEFAAKTRDGVVPRFVPGIYHLLVPGSLLLCCAAVFERERFNLPRSAVPQQSGQEEHEANKSRFIAYSARRGWKSTGRKPQAGSWSAVATAGLLLSSGGSSPTAGA